MFKVVGSAVLCVVCGALILVFIKKIPQVKSLAACYESVNSIYREDYLVTRRAYTNTSTICERNKVAVLRGVECFYQTESQLEALDWEIPYLKKAARIWAKTTNEPGEVVADHNQRCDEEKVMIEEDELEGLKLNSSPN